MRRGKGRGIDRMWTYPSVKICFMRLQHDKHCRCLSAMINMADKHCAPYTNPPQLQSRDLYTYENHQENVFFQMASHYQGGHQWPAQQAKTSRPPHCHAMTTNIAQQWNISVMYLWDVRHCYRSICGTPLLQIIDTLISRRLTVDMLTVDVNGNPLGASNLLAYMALLGQ